MPMRSDEIGCEYVLESLSVAEGFALADWVSAELVAHFISVSDRGSESSCFGCSV